MARYLVFDLETEVVEARKRKASCFIPDNYIVARGWKFQKDAQCSWEYFRSKEESRSKYLHIPEDVTMLIGFNLKFDLMWEMSNGNPELTEFFKRGGKIWDCQYAEYLIEGQSDASQMCSLDSVVEKYHGRKKIDQVKLLWEAGTKTADIPEDLLIDYLVGTEEENRNSGDIGNTELVFLGQIRKATAQNQIKMIQDRMDGLLATTEMEFRGIKVDVAEMGRRLKVLQADLAARDKELNSFIPDVEFEFNWSSNIHKSAIIFGGTVKYQLQRPYKDELGEWARKKTYEQWPLCDGIPIHPDVFENDDTYVQDEYISGVKRGQKKFRKVEVEGPLKVKYQDYFYKFPGYTEPKPEWKGALTDGAGEPVYSVSSDVIEEITLRDIPFLKAMSAKQALDKEIGTYYVKLDPKKGYVGMLSVVQPWDHILHHKLNHTITVTTRLSSSEPNMQNIPQTNKSEVKKGFISRFTEAYCKQYGIPYDPATGMVGKMIEADYSQLEVVVQGVLSGDKQLCDDLRNKIDFHCKRVSAKYGITYEEALFLCKNEEAPDHKLWRDRRTDVKSFSFQRAYGAGAPAISHATGIPIEDIKAMIEAEELLYPGVVTFNSAVEKAVTLSSVPMQAQDENGAWRTYHKGKWVGPTGTIYSFRTHDAPAFLRKRGVMDSYSPPELKNYPVQGTGGEFVQCILGLLWRWFISTDNFNGRAFLVNTVHDCVWIDCHASVLDEVCAGVKQIMQSIPEYYNNRYGMKIDVPFPVEIEHGDNMYTMHGWHPKT